MSKIVSEGIEAALFIMLILSAFSEQRKLWICSWRIVKCLESEELIESQSALWYNLTLIEGSTDLLRLVEKFKWIAKWLEERSLLRVRFWILLKIAAEEIV